MGELCDGLYYYKPLPQPLSYAMHIRNAQDPVL